MGRIKLKDYFYGVLTGVAVTAIVTYFLWQYRPSVETKIVYVDREIPVQVEVPVPDVRTVYRIITDTVYVGLPIPRNMAPMGVIASDYAEVSRRAVTVRYWNPDSLRYFADTFRIRPHRASFWLDSGVGYSRQFYANIGVNFRTKNTTLYTRYGTDGFSFGLRHRVVGI